MKIYLYIVVLILVSSTLKVRSQDKVIHFAKNIEIMFPCWYEILENDGCTHDNAVLFLEGEIKKMDSIIIDILNYEKNDSISEGLNNSILNNWSATRNELVEFYFRNNSSGSLRGIIQVAYKRDLTKMFLISILPVQES